MVAAIPIALAAASTAVSVIGAVKQGRAERAAGEMRAEVAEDNSDNIQQQAAANALVQKENAKRAVGATMAAYGASGISADSGSALDVLSNSVSAAERDRQNILYKGRMNAMGYEVDADLERRGAKNAQTQGYFKASAALLNGGSKIYEMS